MDRRNPYTLSVLAPSQDGEDESRVVTQGRLREFILAFQLDNSFIYRLEKNYIITSTFTDEALRDQLRQNVLIKRYFCDVDIAHLISYNEELAHKLTTEPADIIPLVSYLPGF
jgi:DNA replication licensing factor MCM5